MSQHHILVIDDDERLRDLLRRFLEESGFRVTDAGNASEARQILSGIMFDLLIIDIMMPGETGLEFLQDLRKKDNVPALFLTAMSETEHRIEGLETGADDYMSKPFEPRELVLRIKRILERKASISHDPEALVNFGPFAFDPPNGISIKAHLYVMRDASASTSSCDTCSLNRIPPLTGSKCSECTERDPVKV